MFIILLPASPDWVEETEMNFPFEPHSKAKLAIDLHLFVYYGRLLLAKIGRCRDGCPYLNADWFCASCGQPRQTKVDGRGEEDDCLRLLSCIPAVDAHEQWSRDPHRADALASFLWLDITHNLLCFCYQLKKRWIQRGRLFHSSVWRDLMQSIQAEWNDEKRLRQCKDCGIVRGSRRKENRPTVTQWESNSHFDCSLFWEDSQHALWFSLVWMRVDWFFFFSKMP